MLKPWHRPGGRETWSYKIQDGGLRLVIAGSATKAELEVLLKIAQIEGLIEQATTSSDTEASKPAPDLVSVALGKLKLKPNQVVMIGDTPYDIESAGQLDVGVIAVRYGGFDDSRLADALAIHDDPADLVTHYNSSPLSKAT